MHWVVGFNAKNLIYANKTMVFFVDAAMCIPIDNYHQGWENTPIFFRVDALDFFVLNAKKNPE
jgi:hypothetical protein